MQVDKCVICENEFYVNKMKEGKCDNCNTRFPHIKNKEELEKSRMEAENEKYNKGTLPAIVKTQVEKILEEYGILHKCVCGNLYAKTSPAKKRCGNCGEGDDNS